MGDIWDNRGSIGGESTKKIPTLFERRFGKGGSVVEVLPRVTDGCEWVLRGDGEATEKVDGACCAIIDGVLWKRYDANPNKGRRPPAGGIPCQDAPDPVTGHWPFFLRTQDSGADKWFLNAYYNTPWAKEDGTYEAVGPHFQSNPYGLDDDFLERHGRIKLPDCPRDFDGIREYLREHKIEGVVFWRNGEPRCKIKRRDFGFEWPVKEVD